MHRTRHILIAALLGSTGLLAPVAPVAPSAPSAGLGTLANAAPRPAAVKKAPPTPVSKEHRKALSELHAGFKFGMTKDEVIAVFSKQLDERYDDKIKATTDIAEQDRLRRDKKNEISRLQQSYIAFDSTKPSPWDVSIVEDEFAHNTGEAMLERWENQGGKNNRRFFFFFDGKLWKMFVSLDVSILPEDKKNFASFRQVMERQYGPGEVSPGKITWRTGDLEARAIDKLKSYDALALVIEDPKVRKQVVAVREAKAPPRRETSSVIKAVIDPEGKDHPNVKPSNATVDDVLRAQGASPPPEPVPAPTKPK